MPQSEIEILQINLSLYNYSTDFSVTASIIINVSGKKNKDQDQYGVYKIINKADGTSTLTNFNAIINHIKIQHTKLKNLLLLSESVCFTCEF